MPFVCSNKLNKGHGVGVGVCVCVHVVSVCTCPLVSYIYIYIYITNKVCIFFAIMLCVLLSIWYIVILSSNPWGLLRITTTKSVCMYIICTSFGLLYMTICCCGCDCGGFFGWMCGLGVCILPLFSLCSWSNQVFLSWCFSKVHLVPKSLGSITQDPNTPEYLMS
jgi:hypothetical protein